MKVTPIPARIQALSPQPTPQKPQASPAALAAQQILAARKAGVAPGEAQATQPSHSPPPPQTFFDPKKSADASAHDLPRGSLLDLVV